MQIEEIHKMLQDAFADLTVEICSNEGSDSYLLVPAEALLEICVFLKESSSTDFDFLRLITAVDFGDSFASVYHLYSYVHQHSLVIRVNLDREAPKVPSVAKIWPAADWLERECFDMMGIIYQGHPGLKRILLPLDWEGYPLRKDYQPPEEYHGIKHN